MGIDRDHPHNVNFGRSETTTESGGQNEVAAGLQALLLTNRAGLLRLLAARQVSPGDAEDILQDLFVKLQNQTVGPVAEPFAYLCRMADNLVLDRRRADMRRKRREEEWSGLRTGASATADDEPSIETRLIARERLSNVSQALSRLPERTLQIFRLFKIEGVAQKEIAADLGISVSAVEKHLQRAYQVLVTVRESIDADIDHPRRP
jgi:RNA polymerase sigma-70 factor (ECF subfamily)